MLLLGPIGTHSVKVYVAVMRNSNVCFFQWCLTLAKSYNVLSNPYNLVVAMANRTPSLAIS